MRSPPFLLALDLDGTLLRDDKTIAPEDAAAIREATTRGMVITIATGRLASGALPIARRLRLTTPLICADGGLLVDPRTGAVLDRRVIAALDATAIVEALAAHGLAPFVFLADAIHCGADGEKHRGLVDTWSKNIVVHGSMGEISAWRTTEGVAVTVGLGDRPLVERASAHLRETYPGTLDTVCFGMSEKSVWAVRSLPHGCDKGEMLGRLAGRLGVSRERVAVVGDWLNDLGMFAIAGQSFAMAQAPEIVKRAATCTLGASSVTGGGVAEAIAALLSDLAA
jgi:HAD superfamily hydrolase (TIGR01484 family)